VPVAQVELSGSVTETGGSDSITTAWSVVSGPGTVTFGSPSALSTSAIFGAPGEYVLELSATVGAVSSSATVTVTVSAH
jgi:hypothetical protein